MRPLVAACVLVLGACQPLYGPDAETLHKPPRHPPPKTVVTDPPIAFVEDCTVDFHRDARNVKRMSTASDALVGAGDSELVTATQAPEPARPVIVVRSIQKYADALRADPYNAQATLKLALAYDQVLHKGCALAMLRRLESLTSNPKLASDAVRRIDDVVDNRQWFRNYRKDALTAVNRTGP